MNKRICEILMRLGITSNYYGHYYITDSVQLVLSGAENLLLITKRLYPHVARQNDTSARNVERNIRHAVEIAWRTNPELLSVLAGRKLAYKPTSGEFLSILVSWLLYCEE